MSRDIIPQRVGWFVVATGALMWGLHLGTVTLLAQVITMIWRHSRNDSVLLSASELVMCTSLQFVALLSFYIVALALWRSTGGYCNGLCFVASDDVITE